MCCRPFLVGGSVRCDTARTEEKQERDRVEVQDYSIHRRPQVRVLSGLTLCAAQPVCKVPTLSGGRIEVWDGWRMVGRGDSVRSTGSTSTTTGIPLGRGRSGTTRGILHDG